MDVSAILAESAEKSKAITVTREIDVDIDLGLLAVFDPNPIDSEEYAANKEQVLADNARDGIQLLINELWGQPTKVVDDSVIATLPEATTALPREKSLPKAKPMTKWEAFAKAKGINKTKRDKKVFDEATGEWVDRWGFKGKNKELDHQWLVEVPNGKDDSYDPRAEARSERTDKVKKNEEQRLKNMQRSAANEAAADPRAAKEALSKSRINALKSQEAAAKVRAQRDVRKLEIERNLKITKKATASLGKYDDKLVGEKKEKHVKRKFAPNEIDHKTEQETSLAILSKIGALPNKKARTDKDTLINTRKAIKHMTSGKGVTSLDDKRKRKGGRK